MQDDSLHRPRSEELSREENGQVRNYTFNALNQIATATAPDATDVRGTVGPALVAPFAVTVDGEPATVDAEGNWIRQDVPLVQGENAIAIQATDKYGRTAGETRAVVRADPPPYAHDANGNLTVCVAGSPANLWSLSWNEENRLASASDVLYSKLEFSYDGLGRRRVKKVYQRTPIGWTLQSETRFVYDGNNLVAELDQNDAMTRVYAWGPDLSGTLDGAAGVGGLLAVSTTSGTFYPTFDGNGNVTAYVDAADAEVATAEYDPFGKIIASTGAAPCAFGFSTVYRDDETGLLAYRFRDYDPNLGRWPSRDPIGEMGGVNLYVMVGNDAVGRVDLWGLKKCEVILWIGHNFNVIEPIESGMEESHYPDVDPQSYKTYGDFQYNMAISCGGVQRRDGSISDYSLKLKELVNNPDELLSTVSYGDFLSAVGKPKPEGTDVYKIRKKIMEYDPDFDFTIPERTAANLKKKALEIKGKYLNALIDDAKKKAAELANTQGCSICCPGGIVFKVTIFEEGKDFKPLIEERQYPAGNKSGDDLIITYPCTKK